MVFVGQEPWHSWAVSSGSGSLMRLLFTCLPWLWFLLKAWLGKDLFPSSRSCWEHSVSWRLSDWGPWFLVGCQFLATWASPHSVLLHLPSKVESLLARQKPQAYIASSQKWHRVIFTIFCWLEARHQSSLHSRGGIDYVRACITGGEDRWLPSLSPLATDPHLKTFFFVYSSEPCHERFASVGVGGIEI